MTSSDDCYSCAQEARTGALPARECIAADDHWRVAHALGTVVEGWLVLLPRRHIESVSELTDVEAEALGLWQVRLSRALHQVTGCKKTYIAQFAEAARPDGGTARTEDLPDGAPRRAGAGDRAEARRDRP